MTTVACCLRCSLLIALASAATSALAAPTLREYLRACGIGDGDFTRIVDDRQMADEELDVVCRIAVRLRDCPADSLRRLMAADPGGGEVPSRTDAKEHRGQAMRLRGHIESTEAAMRPLWRCTIASEDQPHRAIVYVAELSKDLRHVEQIANLPTVSQDAADKRQIGNLPHAGEQVAVDAVFVKYVPGERDRPVPVFVAGRLQRRATGPLGELDFDLALCDDIRDNAPMAAADSRAFYRLLALTGTARSPFSAEREAISLDAAAAARLFNDPAAERGRLFRVAGRARRAVRVPIDDAATTARLGTDHYFQIDLLSDALQDNPLVFCTLEMPPGMPLSGSPDYSQPVEVTGFFLKMWQYPTGLTTGERAEHPELSNALQAAPLLVGPPPKWKPAPAATSKSGWLTGGIVALAMTGLGLLLLHLRQSDQEFSSRSQL